MKLYHGSPIANISELIPSKDAFGDGLVYFSLKRENVLPYLSDPYERFCYKNKLKQTGDFHKFSSYGFNNGILEFHEYYPNALFDTYKGVSGYIYSTESYEVFRRKNMPFVYVSNLRMGNLDVEFIPDAYKEILRLEQLGLIKIKRYKQNTKEDLKWIEKTVKQEYIKNKYDASYTKFLITKFSFITKKQELVF